MTLALQPLDFDEACKFVSRLHRHHRPPLGSKFQIGVNDGEKLVGVIIVGRPIGRRLDDGITMEATRCCTDGTKNACSILYSAAWRAVKALGYWRMVTYTTPKEGGASLKASGARFVGMAGKKGGGGWSCETRPRLDDHPTEEKWRWEWTTSGPTVRIREATAKAEETPLFSILTEQAKGAGK